MDDRHRKNDRKHSKSYLSRLSEPHQIKPTHIHSDETIDTNPETIHSTHTTNY